MERVNRNSEPLSLGILGTSRIASLAVLGPARHLGDVVRVAAIASRDENRSRWYAEKFKIPKSYESYEKLLEDSSLNAVYIPLPNGLHRGWAERALTAGKHVLVEKPLAMNASEASALHDLASRENRVLLEAMHYRYHPVARRVREIIGSGVLGRLEHVESHVSFPVLLRSNLRYDYQLGGGATMDQGCYAVNLVRFAAGEEPQVVAAEARLFSSNVDRFMSADLTFPSGATGRVVCSIWSTEFMKCNLTVRGSRGEMRVTNPIAPHLFHSIRWYADGRWHKERLKGPGQGTTYFYQLRAFVEAIRKGTGEAGDRDAVNNLRVIDEMYRKAGLTPRTSVP